MKDLVFVRHGNYDENTGFLDDSGKRQLRKIAKILKARFSGKSVLVLYSPKDRARESAEIIKNHVPSKSEERSELISNFIFQDTTTVLELIREKRDTAEVLVIVSHLEHCKNVPAELWAERWGEPHVTPELKKGEALIMDIEGRSLEHVQSSE